MILHVLSLENAYRWLNNVVGTDRAPGDSSWVSLAKYSDGFALDPKLSIFLFDGAFEIPVHGIIFEHVDLFITNRSDSAMHLRINYIDTNHVVKVDERTVMTNMSLAPAANLRWLTHSQRQPRYLLRGWHFASRYGQYDLVTMSVKRSIRRLVILTETTSNSSED